MPTITGTSGDDNLTGTDGPDTIYGGDGNDTIDAGASGSIDDHIEDGAGNDVVHGGLDADYIICSPGNDLYDGGTGATTFGTDFDTVDYSSALAGINVDLTRSDYQVWSTGSGDAAAIGHDQLENIEAVVGSAFDDVMTGGAANIAFDGGDGNDTLKGGSGDDTLIGGAGNDLMDGGAGEDQVSFGAAATGVHVSLAETGAQDTGQGIDTLINIEDVYGSQFSDVLTGGSGDNVLAGGAGGDDQLFGGAGSDELYGSPFGNNYLDGGTGADFMEGGYGSDTYIVDNPGDQVIDDGDDDGPLAALDTVRASVTYALRPGFGVEDLVLTGSAAINGTGNELNNKLTGNSAANQLFGNAGNDVLNGSAGNDCLDGGAGTDRMSGGTGNDTYYVDAYGDRVIENAGEGTDSVYASANYRLSDNVERLTLTGSEDLYGYGNGLDNQLTGNSGSNKLIGLDGNDTIDGKGGADRMTGGLGDDRYYVDNYSDRVIENAGEGTDAVFTSVNYRLAANVERLTLTGSADIWAYGSADDNVLTGNDGINKLYGMGGSDTLSGGNGNDWLEGGAGQDRLTGGSGADNFVFRDGDFGGATAATADRILDFAQGEDHIRLNFVDADTTLGGDQAFAFLGTAAFDGHAGELRYEQISGNTYISGDTNGDGIADFMIRVDGLHALGSGDFAL